MLSVYIDVEGGGELIGNCWIGSRSAGDLKRDQDGGLEIIPLYANNAASRNCPGGGEYVLEIYLTERLAQALEWWNVSSCGVLIPSIVED